LLKIPVGNPESRHKALKPQVRGHLLAGPDSLPAELARLLAVARRRLQLIYLAPNLGFSQIDLILKNGPSRVEVHVKAMFFLIHQRDISQVATRGLGGVPRYFGTPYPGFAGARALFAGVGWMFAAFAGSGDRRRHGRPGW
jgi:hypothetical protein